MIHWQKNKAFEPPTIILVCVAILISACSETNTDSSQARTDTLFDAAKIIKNEAVNGLAIGTNINGLVKPETLAKESTGNLQIIGWDDLIPADYDVESIIAKYQSQIDLTLEGSPEEIAIYKIMQEEFNKAPPNTTLNNKMVKIPGFVAPLDETNGMVGEFLLVPYFGSCIHAPPPPVNQTIVVNPLQGKSIEMSKITHPVWVIGEIKVKRSSTDLAEAGYSIENAKLEIYSNNL